ncbi:pyridoxal 5'-phosphate synthase glutaminase subunit PdxT [Candidatus Marsarchaeota G1 archaeon OSP_D]|jgi:5'-phosphate synthase pdxT subunit|uniref:Pyridoxal 5'-phosphate synthase subunit PdxT n=4 Tax=Candidatus Marsarchaeota group 1 TaxID=2203770 RepID=A0A2R6AJF1_9ARCH|nr:MAG: pyridoxal 5'-phosphate synthase glutaminase subunit PdxT [Candidatus Marsarchaeota G1 archaeon OSP_D]PSN86505.1 MAG: pyridoxal 5'-phosphate synthase glutaminase subunit PdxT [Candidatus Marsarchaeota G1 archaeon BE_D]PSN89200.1 MAG: pyridoxal 5'-phosphate synthase glutaminase subunit PdxT [Candidatus Marsarchaeota G1 archaeon OSP_C]
MVVNIGVLGFQGDIEEHVEAWRNASEELGVKTNVLLVKKAEQVKQIDAISIPGGESTVIGSLSERMRVMGALKEAILGGLPTLGTCAGLIVLAKRSKDAVVTEKTQPLLGVMDVEVERNHFGRQNDSFEADLKIPVLGEKPFRAVFIRAPIITRTGPGVEVLAEMEDGIVAARQANIVSTAFHPELSGDTRFHKYFLKDVAKLV